MTDQDNSGGLNNTGQGQGQKDDSGQQQTGETGQSGGESSGDSNI